MTKDKMLGWIEETEGTMVSIRNLLTAEEMDLEEIKRSINWALFRLELMDCIIRQEIVRRKEARL